MSVQRIQAHVQQPESFPASVVKFSFPGAWTKNLE